MGSAHAYFLPSEAVFADPRGWRTMTPESLARAIEVSRRRGGRWHFGPIPKERLGGLPAPAAEEAKAMVDRRFAPYFGLAGLSG